MLIIIDTSRISFREMSEIEYLERTEFKVNTVPRWQYLE